MKIIRNLLFLMLFATPLGALAQTPEPGKDQKRNKALVTVPVVVSDRDGRRIAGLKKEDFTVFQGGVKQNIASFATDDEPINVALLLDTSGSTQEVLEKIKDAAKDFIDLLNPADQCMIATFDSKVNILIPFTSERQGLKKSLDKIQTADKEGTVMFSAIEQIAQNSFSRISGRKAIVILSDGKDVGSSVTRKELISLLEESDASIYAVHYQSGIGFNKPVISVGGTIVEGKPVTSKKEKKPKAKKNVYTILIPLPAETYSREEIKLIDQTATIEAVDSFKSLSDTTGGRFYLSDDAKLSQIFKQVAAEMRQQYTLGVFSENADEIIVKVNRSNVVVNTRTKLLPK